MPKLTLKAIAAKLLATPEMDLLDREIADVTAESMSVTMTIGQIFTLVQDKNLKRNIMQRNDEMRRQQGRAKHVTGGLHVAHLDIVVAFWKNEYHLVDGCHRVGHWFDTLGCQLPSHVTVLLKRPRTQEEYFALYRAYDSNKSTKSKRDYLFGYMRYLKADKSIKSHVLQTGSWVTAFNNLHRGGKATEELETVRAYLPALKKLDGHGLKSEEIPQGFLLATIRLYHTMRPEAEVGAYVNDLITAYTRGTSSVSQPTKQAMHAFATVREKFGDNIGGELATREIADVIEVGFDSFCRARHGKQAKEFVKERVLAPMSRAKLV